MALRIAGASVASRLLRTSAVRAPAVGSNSNCDGRIFPAWKVLAVAAAASSSVAAGTAWSESAAESESGIARDGLGGKASSAEHRLHHCWRAILHPSTTASTTACEAAADPDLDANSEEQVEAVLKSRITSREELSERRRQRDKFRRDQAENTLHQTVVRKRMTNVGRFSLVSETARNPSVPVLVMAMTGKPFYAEDFRRLYRERGIAERYPRFGARLNEGKTHFVFDGGESSRNKRGVIGRDNVRETMYPRIRIAELKDRINDASLYAPLDLTSRLWEAWTATGGAVGQSGIVSSLDSAEKVRDDERNVESLLLFRAHHCMADGVSLGALFSDLVDEGPEIRAHIQSQIKLYKKSRRGTPWWKKLLSALYYWIWGSMKALMYQAYLFAISWYDRYEHDDPWMILKASYDKKRQTEEEERKVVPPRSLSWEVIAPVDEVKRVARFYSKMNREQTGQKSKVTINDVFCSCASAAIIKQLEYHRAVNPKLSSSGQRLSLPSMNLIIPVHLQGGIILPGQGLGNKIGAMVSRIPGERISNKMVDGDDRTALAQERLIRVHSVLNARKQTPVAALSYLVAGVMGYLSPSSAAPTSATSAVYSVGSSPSSWTPWFFRKAHANASLVVTNVRGPEFSMHLEGRPVRAFLGFLPLPAGVPVGLVVTSYSKKIVLSVTAEEYAVPDPEQFLGWVREEYEFLKQRADEAEEKSN